MLQGRIPRTPILRCCDEAEFCQSGQGRIVDPDAGAVARTGDGRVTHGRTPEDVFTATRPPIQSSLDGSFMRVTLPRVALINLRTEFLRRSYGYRAQGTGHGWGHYGHPGARPYIQQCGPRGRAVQGVGWPLPNTA